MSEDEVGHYRTRSLYGDATEAVSELAVAYPSEEIGTRIQIGINGLKQKSSNR